MRAIDALVVGAGPAGLAAAAETTRHGLDTMLVDSRHQAGGLYHARPLAAAWSAGLPDALTDGLDRERLEARMATQVWGVFGDRVFGLAGPAGCELVLARAVVIATGAVESPVPFPGWEGPNVMAAGAAQLLLKESRAIPAGRVVVAGTGPFLLAVAAQLAGAGADLVGVVEAVPRRSQLPMLPALAARPARAREAAGYLRALRSVPIYSGRRIEAAGTTELRLAGGGRLACDVVVAGHGFRPRLELPRLLGCRVESGAVAVDGELATSVPGIYAAGEVTGIGGAELAAAEGRLAGLAIAGGLGRLRAKSRDRQRVWTRRRRAADRFAQMLGRTYPVPGPLSLATDATVICRCEGATLGQIRQAAAGTAAGDGAGAIKALLRCGMGPCQGAMCWAAVEVCAAGGGPPPGTAWRPRLPIGVVTVGALAGSEELDLTSRLREDVDDRVRKRSP